MHTGQFEGVNNKLIVMKRMVYDYRDSEFLVLNFKAAFSGNP
jgi:transposase